MKKRKRKYYCSHCKKTMVTVSDKQWIKSICEASGKDVRMYLAR